MLALFALASPVPHGRALSATNILAYSPGSQVTDHANIDLDQQALETALGTYDWTTTSAIYTSGAHSKPRSTCTLTSPSTLGQTVAKGDSVTFTSTAGTSTTGKAYSAYASQGTSFRFTYPVSDLRVQPAATACYEGGLPTSAYSAQGCIAVSSGSSTFVIGATTYTATCTNNGGRTLQGFSTKAQSTMYDCAPALPPNATYPAGCPYTSYVPYYNYYGVYDYANKIVLAAIGGSATSGFTNNGPDMTGLADVIRKEYIKKGTAYMNTWMYTIREFEDAIDDCSIGDLTSNALSSGPVHAWDEGVAFYTGSIMEQDDLFGGNLPTLDSQGKQPYTLANKRCKNYVTCGPGGNARVGEAKVNIELFELFRRGQYELLVGNCAAIVPIKNDIVTRMTVPLVQGTLRYAYKMAFLSGGDKEKAEGGIFAASVLPQVHACSATHAATIQTNMNINSAAAVDYAAVKVAFEACYAAMGITCADVGGLYNSATSTYYTGAEPCVESPPPAAPDPAYAAPPSPPTSPPYVQPPASPGATSMPGYALPIIIVCAVLAVGFLVCVCFLVSQEKKGKPVFTSLSEPGSKPATSSAAA